MKYFLLIGFLFSFLIQAQAMVSGEGRFFAKEDDTLPFVKTQLLNNAFRDVFTKELVSMGMDHELFWRNLDIAFEESFLPIQNRLKRKYGIGTSKENAQSRLNYQNALREKKLTAKARFGKIDRAVTSYSIQEMSRSTNQANSRFLSLQAKLDRKVIFEIYSKFTKTAISRKFDNLYYSVEINLINKTTWEDLGVDGEESFVNVLKEHWGEWLNKGLSEELGSVEQADMNLVSKINKHLLLPGETAASLQKIEESDELQVEKKGFDNSLWLNIRMNVEKKNEKTTQSWRYFEIEGDLALVDLRSGELISHGDFSKEKKRYSYKDSHQLSSNLASFIYRLPLGSMGQLREDVSKLPSQSEIASIKVGEVSSVQDLFILKELLIQKGSGHQFTPQISSYNGSNGNFSLKFKGTIEEARKVLLGLDEYVLKNGKKISIIDKSDPFQVTLLSENQ